ncbi:Retrovirus-related Pol polyprotein from transposon opus, partial [Nosema granulosis]
DIVESDLYSSPAIDDLIYGLRDKRWFSKIDLKEGFFQIHLQESDKKKTAFKIKNKLYEWNRMPMGFKNSSAVFQRVMDKVLEEEIGKNCYVYIDDILIYGETEEEHDMAFIRICDKLSKAGFQANQDKIEFKKKEVTFLGHNIAYNCIKSHMDPAEGFKNYKRPENIEEVRRFLGIVNYYRKFIQNCAQKAEPINRLLRKEIKFEWKESQEEAFVLLKNEILGEKCLIQPDFKRRFILTTDASNKGLGVVLSQEEDGVERPVAFASRGLRPAERNYSITEKEMLAALWGMEYFDMFLYGREFTVFTDHKALEAWNRKGVINSARIERWHERLQRYNCNMKYKKPEELKHADDLSRSMNMIASGIEDEKSKMIAKAHDEVVHRGAKATYEYINNNMKDENISFKEVQEMLRKCFRCKLYNPIKISGWRYIESYSPGEKVAFDIIGPIEDQYIITAIDYFSRFAMAEVINSRSSANVIKFLKKVHFELSIKTLISDSAKENNNEEIKKNGQKTIK